MLQQKEIFVEGYERVIEFKEENTGLHALIALHDTRLGPALGGIRVYPYPSFEAGLTDVLRLARGMSYKAAVAQVGTGGGKSVLFLKKGQEKTEALLRSLAEAVNTLEGKYICAEDYGLTQEDLRIIGLYTPYIVGTPKTSGDPSRFTSFGGFRGIQAVAHHLWGSDSLEGKVIALQGLGAAGMKLAHHLFWAGARLIVCDINQEVVTRAVRDVAAEAASVKEIFSVPCDIFAPCALGGILNDKTLPQLKCQAVAGLANNQLLTPEEGVKLQQKGILYAPDYVINAGGLLNVCQEISPEGYCAARARCQVDQLYTVLLRIFALAEQKKQPTSQVAQEMAEHNLNKGIGKRLQAPCFVYTQTT